MSDYMLELEEACNTLVDNCKNSRCATCLFGPTCKLTITPPSEWPVDKIFRNEQKAEGTPEHEGRGGEKRAGEHSGGGNDRQNILLEAMRQFDAMTLSIAYVYAKNLSMYGANVAERWITATEQSAILEQAYRKGYYDAFARFKESEDKA